MLKRLFANTLSRELLTFAYIGILTNAFGYALFLLLTQYLLFSPYLAVTFLYPLGIILSYNFNKKYTFANSTTTQKERITFFFIYLLGYFLNIVILFLLITVFNFLEYIAQAIAVVTLALYFFFMQKNYVF